MAGQVQQSAFVRKYGTKAAASVKAHAGETKGFGRGQLPPGVRNGIAELTDAVIGYVENGKQNAGEPYLRLAGVARFPESVMVEGVSVKVEGCQTSQLEMLCDTKSDNKTTTFDEHMDNALARLRDLGVDTAPLAESSNPAAAFESAVASLHKIAKSSKIYFSFTTQLGKETIDPKTKKPRERRVWENWGSVCEFNGTMNNGVEDGTTTVGGVTAEGQAAADEANGQVFDEFAGGDATTTTEDDGLDALAAKADPPVGDVKAAKELEKIALAAGVTQEDFDQTGSYAEAVDLIRGVRDATDAATAAVEADAESQAEEPPAVNAVYGLELEVLKDPKNPKKGKTKKKLQVIIKTVDVDTRTVTVADNATKKFIPVPGKPKEALSVSWDDLIVE